MKVLKPGRPQKGWSTEATCTGNGNGDGGCGAVLLVEQDDLFRTTRCCRDEVDYFTTFACPQCGVLTDLHEPLPYSLKSKLPDETAWRHTHPDPKG